MGKGISLAFSLAGYNVSLIDSEPREKTGFQELRDTILVEAKVELSALRDLSLLNVDELESVLHRIDILPFEEAGLRIQQADFVFEAVVEVMDVKKSVYEWLNKNLKPGAIVSSTTSTMSANELACFLKHDTPFINAHWLNPAFLIPLVEVSPADATEISKVEELKSLLEDIGKVTVLCKASPGFIVARIQAVALNEAARIVEDGVASAEDVDKAIKTGFGIRYATQGLLEFIDFGGGDVLYHATSYLGSKLGEARFSVPPIIRKNMENNKNGIRDGAGFYNWEGIDTEAYKAEKMSEFIRLLQHRNLVPRIEGEKIE